MSTLTSLARNCFLVAMVAVGATTVADNASACDVYYKTVTTHVTVQKPVVYYVTRYDHCGEPYYVRMVGHRSYQVPVVQRVAYHY